jgi:hypothetical protein
VVDPLDELQDFIDERWRVAQPKYYPSGPERLYAPEVTANEAAWFLAAARSWLRVDDERKLRSKRFPRLSRGGCRGYNFFERAGRREEGRGRLRDEWIVHFAAAERLRCEFEWPLDRFVFESPKVLGADGAVMLHQDAVDILLLRERCPRPEWKMAQAALRSAVIVEAKFKVTGSDSLDGMIGHMSVCDGAHDAEHDDHTTCRGLQVFRPDLVLGVAALETWSLFEVVEGDDLRLVLADEPVPRDQHGARLRFTK